MAHHHVPLDFLILTLFGERDFSESTEIEPGRDDHPIGRRLSQVGMCPECGQMRRDRNLGGGMWGVLLGRVTEQNDLPIGHWVLSSLNITMHFWNPAESHPKGTWPLNKDRQTEEMVLSRAHLSHFLGLVEPSGVDTLRDILLHLPETFLQQICSLTLISSFSPSF